MLFNLDDVALLSGPGTLLPVAAVGDEPLQCVFLAGDVLVVPHHVVWQPLADVLRVLANKNLTMTQKGSLNQWRCYQPLASDVQSALADFQQYGHVREPEEALRSIVNPMVQIDGQLEVPRPVALLPAAVGSMSFLLDVGNGGAAEVDLSGSDGVVGEPQDRSLNS